MSLSMTEKCLLAIVGLLMVAVVWLGSTKPETVCIERRTESSWTSIIDGQETEHFKQETVSKGTCR